jgi:hypothetical protein
MVAPAVAGIDLFKIAGRSISGWVLSFKLSAVAPVKQPFCSQLEERLILWLEYHPHVQLYVRGDIGPQPVLDPAHSGRVTMDYLMKLVTTALEWAYQAGAPDVRAETLEHAAELLVLRRDSLRIIDGAGPSIEAPHAPSPEQEMGSGMEPERAAGSTNEKPIVTGPHAAMGYSAGSAQATKCPFAGVVPIDLQRFADNGARLVECPDCGATRSLEPHRGVLHFKSHDKRKTQALVTSVCWARRETIWTVVGGENQ